MTHDPLCQIHARCKCEEYARVREDERMRDDDYAYVATQSYAAALRDALEAVGKFDDTDAYPLIVAAIETLGNER